MIKLFISPNYKHAPENVDRGGIKGVVMAENKYLEQFGVESVANINEADVIQNHGGMQTRKKGIPILNTSHGLYWSRYPWGDGIQSVNKELMDAMAMAQAQTAPSEWVARAIRRGAYIYPEVVLHGVDSDEFKPSTHPGNYILYNKLRQDYVSDARSMNEVAKLLPDIDFLSTVGAETNNVHITGAMSYEKMKTVVADASVYLSTTRETFGIGTLEALASGVPVSGFLWGGNEEIIIQGETGYLAPPGRFDILAECIKRCISERKRLSANCVDDARMRWKWQPRISQYANIVKGLYEFTVCKRPTVTVVVTTYNLDKYLPVCLDSVKRQTLEDFECLVIDDAQSEPTKQIVEGYDKRFRYIPTPENLGLPGARNFGFSKSKGEYIQYLDADDWLADNALAIKAGAMDDNPFIHIAYGHLAVTKEDGEVYMENGSPARGNWPPEQFSWIEQMAHLNQLPSCAMMRREVMQRSGGYRIRNKRQEDAEFWCRVTSFGFRAKKVTQAITYYHRMRTDSKGQKEWDTQGGEPDWTAWFPWRLGAKNGGEGRNLLRKYGGMHPFPQIVPFGAQGDSSDGKFWYVHDHSYPSVSIIVTCGPGHKEYLIDALDSIQAQTYPDWECVVVNDTSEKWPAIPGAPWAKVINLDGNQGTAAARNAGFDYTRGRYIIYMDADDYWLPWYLERMVAYAEANKGGIIFSDIIMDDGEKKKIYTYNEVNYEEVPYHMSYAGSSILIPWEVVNSVNNLQGGYDKLIPGMEDFDFQIACHHRGFCAYHLPEALFVYRLTTSTKRERDYGKIEDIRAYLDKKWKVYRKEGKKLMCGCSSPKKTNSKPLSMLTSSGNFSMKGLQVNDSNPMQMVTVEYVGPIAETFSIRSRVDRGINYRFGNNPYHKERIVFMEDAEYLISMLDGNGKPMYRIKGVSSISEHRDPTEIVGAIAS